MTKLEYQSWINADVPLKKLTPCGDFALAEAIIYVDCDVSQLTPCRHE